MTLANAIANARKPRKRIRRLAIMLERVRRLQVEKRQIRNVDPAMLSVLIAEERALEFALQLLTEIYPPKDATTAPICGNCDTPVPPGCEGIFRDDGQACALHQQTIKEST